MSELVPIEEITFDDSIRQRKELTGIEELAASIERIGLLAPVIIDSANQLIAGRRRLEACKRLGHRSILARRFESLGTVERRVIELDENFRRVDLSWQERSRALVEIAGLLPEKSSQELASYLGLGESSVSEHLSVGKAMAEGNERVLAAANFRQALEIIRRRNQLVLQTALSQIGEPDGGEPEHSTDSNPAETSDGGGESRSLSFSERATAEGPGVERADRVSKPPAAHAIRRADFLQFAQEYSGPKFNFIHCDFPYGINFERSAAAGSAAHESQYADSPELFWSLTEALVTNKENLFLDSAHCLFWFSMKYYGDLLERFSAAGFRVHELPLIWHKSDGMGIASDYRRRPKHIYETALWLSLGDRPLTQLRNDVFSHPIAKSEEGHLSAKPEPMLRYFLSMGVSDLTHFLDPTCGSGTSIRAAKALGAARAIGLEINPETAARAEIKLASMEEELPEP